MLSAKKCGMVTLPDTQDTVARPKTAARKHSAPPGMGMVVSDVTTLESGKVLPRGREIRLRDGDCAHSCTGVRMMVLPHVQVLGSSCKSCRQPRRSHPAVWRGIGFERGRGEFTELSLFHHTVLLSTNTCFRGWLGGVPLSTL